jgi:hypothetical protein
MLSGRRRIMVVGCGGAGKSTVARELAGLTGLPLMTLSFWTPALWPEISNLSSQRADQPLPTTYRICRSADRYGWSVDRYRSSVDR